LKEIFTNILKGKLEFDKMKWKGISDHAKEFISRLLEFDPEKRPNAQECLKMKWVRRFSKNKECGTNIISKTALKNL
jgi:serine/threonine protein kinase